MPPQQPQIQGLPEGAELRPIEGLPEGAELRSIDQAGYPHYEGTPPEEPSFREKAQKAFDAATQPEPYSSDAGVAGNAGRAFRNLGGGFLSLATPFMHPLETAKAVGRSTPVGMAADAVINRTTLPEETVKGLLPQQGEGMGKYAGRMGAAATSGAGALFGGMGLGEIGSAVMPYKSPIVPAAETNAERLMKAILPQEGVTPGNVRAAMQEAPAVRAFAQRTGNPLRTVPEGMKAAQGVADEGLQHYRSQFLEPNAGERVTLENGVSKLGNTATLGEIEKRISDINDAIRGATRTAKSGGMEMTALERQGLENEAGALRSKLYHGLSEKTGVSPEDIQSLREGYGGQYTLKNALESGHMGRLTRSAASSQGEGVGIYPSKAGLIDKTLTALRGGPEAIANRQFRKAIKAFDPQAPNYPTPTAQQASPFAMPPISEDMARRIGAVGTDEGVQPRPAPTQRPLNGPMSKAPAVAEAEKASQALQNEQNQAFHGRRAANLEASQARKPQGMGPTEPPSAEIVNPPANYAQNLVNRIRKRVGESRANLPAPEPPTQPNPMDRFLGAARETQEQARTLRRKK